MTDHSPCRSYDEVFYPSFASASPPKLPSLVNSNQSTSNEAQKWVDLANAAIDNSRNLKREYKYTLKDCIKNLFKIIKSIPLNNNISNPAPSSSSSHTLPIPSPSVHSSLPNHDELLAKLDEHSKLLNENKSAMNKLTSNINKINSQIAPSFIQPAPVHSSKTRNLTYAEIVSSQKSTGPSIIVSDNTNSSPQKIIESFRKSINFREGGYAPLRISPLSKGKIKIIFENNNNKTDALNQLHKSPNLLVEEERRFDPLIFLKGISLDTPENDLIGIIKDQNPLLRDEKFHIKFRRRNRNEKLYNIVLSTSPSAWHVFMNLGRIAISYQRVHSENFSHFIQCRNCQGFGHSRSRCPSSSPTCAKCALSHLTFNCEKSPSDNPRCINCDEHNRHFKTKTDCAHRADSDICPKVRAMRARVEAKVNYN